MYAFLIHRHLLFNVLFHFTVMYRIANFLYPVRIYFFMSSSHSWMETNRKFRYKIVAIDACIHYPKKVKYILCHSRKCDTENLRKKELPSGSRNRTDYVRKYRTKVMDICFNCYYAVFYISYNIQML
jgi:hypothetical protein